MRNPTANLNFEFDQLSYSRTARGESSTGRAGTLLLPDFGALSDLIEWDALAGIKFRKPGIGLPNCILRMFQTVANDELEHLGWRASSFSRQPLNSATNQPTGTDKAVAVLMISLP